jgi:hypothetical protein
MEARYHQVNQQTNEQQRENEKLISDYSNSIDLSKKSIILALDDYQRRVLYDFYIQELEETISNSAHNQTVKKAARDVLNQVKKSHRGFLHQFEDMKFADDKLFEVLHKTSTLMKTSPILEGQPGIINPEFTHQLKSYRTTINSLGKDARINTVKGVAYLLATVLMLAGAAALLMTTFGAGGAALGIGALVGNILGAGTTIGFSIYTGGGMIGLFNKAHHAYACRNRMHALEKALLAP